MHRTTDIPVDARQKQRALTCLLGTLCCAMLLALALPSLLGGLPLADDLGAFHYPLKVFYSQQLAAGEPFDWWPQIFGGTYITGEGQLGGYHPWHVAIYRLLPVDIAFRLELWTNYAFLLLGMLVLLRRWQLGWSAALFGAMAFTFGGFNLLHYVHVNAMAVVAHLPWLLWTADIALTAEAPPRCRWARLLFSVLIASQLLFGYPQYVWICLLAVIGYVGYTGTRRRQNYCGGRHHLERQARRKPGAAESVTGAGTDFRRRSIVLALAALTGVLIGGVQLLPTYDALQHSVRTEMDAGFAVSGSLHPLNLMQLVAPYVFQNRVVGANTHELGLYAGSVTLVLVVWLFCHWTLAGQLRPVAWAAVALALFALWMAFGDYGLIYRVQTWLPIVGKFRFPCRMIVLFQLALAILAAIAWSGLLKHRREILATRTLWPRAAALLVLASIAVPLLAWFCWPEHTAGGLLMISGVVLVATAAALVTLAARGHTWAWYALALLAAADWGLYGFSYAVYPPRELATANMPVGDGRIALNVADSPQVRGNEATIADHRRIDGYAGLVPRQRLDYRHVAALRLAGVDWVAEDREIMGEGAEQLQRCNGFVRINGPLPRTWLVGHAQVSEKLHEDLPAIDPWRTALVESPLELDEADRGRSIVAIDRPGNIALDIVASGQQLAIVTESYHAGWRASVNGRPVEPVRAYGDFIGIPVAAGDSRVSLEFQPASLRRGALLSACGLGLLWIVYGCSVWQDRVGKRVAA